MVRPLAIPLLGAALIGCTTQTPTIQVRASVERCFNNVAFIEVANNWFVPVQDATHLGRVVMCD